MSFYIRAKVTAGSAKEEFKQKGTDSFVIKVRQRAERNLANTRVLELLAEHFSVPVSKVRIVNGHRHPSKLLIVED